MVERFGRTPGVWQLPLVFLVLAIAPTVTIERSSRGRVLTMTMNFGRLENAEHYRWIEGSMRNYLRNDPEPDSSFIHVLVHPKVNPRLAEAVLKACASTKSTVVRRSEQSATAEDCNFNETCSKIARVVGIFEDIDDVKPHLWKVSYGQAWNPRAKIAIWLGRNTENGDSIDRTKFEEILASFWSVNAVNVVLLASSSFGADEKNSSLRVFGYDPFLPKPGRTERRGRLLERSFDVRLFPDKLRNLRGTSLRVSVYQQEPHALLIEHAKLGSGTEVNNLRYMSQWLNFTVEVVSAPTTFTSYEIQLPDGRSVGPIGDILKNRSVYLANSEYVENTWGERVEFLRPFSRAYVSILVPPAGRIPGILRVFRSLEPTVLGLIFLSSLFLASYLAARRKRDPILATIRLLLHQQIEEIGDGTPERIFLIFWIMWAFVVSTATQSQLIKDLTSAPFYKSIDTLEELLESPLTPMIERVDITSLRNYDSEVKNRLAERAVYEPNFARCTELLARYGNVSCAIDSLYVSRVASNLNRRPPRKTSDRKKIVHVVKEVLTEYWRTVVVQEGFPYLDKLNVGYYRIIEFGLGAKWYRESTRAQFANGTHSSAHPKLRMKHFGGTFKILLCGQAAAFVLFIAEIICHYGNKRLRSSPWWPSSIGVCPRSRDRSRTNDSQSTRAVRGSFRGY